MTLKERAAPSGYPRFHAELEWQPRSRRAPFLPVYMVRGMWGDEADFLLVSCNLEAKQQLSAET